MSTSAQVAIITTPREPEYVTETIVQVAAGMPFGAVTLVSDDPRREQFIEENGEVIWMRTRHGAVLMPYATVHWMPMTIWAIAQGLTRAQRACLNFLSALKMGVGDLVVFEDDVAVKPNWWDHVHAIQKESGAEFVSMYWPDGEALEECLHSRGDQGEIRWRYYKKPETFHGSLGLWIRGDARADLACFLEQEALANPQHLRPFDNTVGDWLRMARLGGQDHSIAACVPALVDHRGEISVIPENASHGLRKSPGF